MVEPLGVVRPCARAAPLIYTCTNGEDDEEVGQSVRIHRLDIPLVDAVYQVRHAIAPVRVLAVCQRLVIGLSNLPGICRVTGGTKSGREKMEEEN